jgi:hypothetical protein
MKRAIKVAVIVLLIVLLVPFILALPYKQENLLQVHYDTLEERNLERISYFGIDMKQTVKWHKGGYQEQYREIFDANPSVDRWRSWPIRTISLGTERWRSPVTPYSLSLRRSIVQGIYTQYEQDKSVQGAKDAFTALEAILPGSKAIEEFGPEQVRAAEELVAESPLLQNLEFSGVDSIASEQKTKSEAGTEQPATRPLLDSEGSDKPQPEAKGRSR